MNKYRGSKIVKYVFRALCIILLIICIILFGRRNLYAAPEINSQRIETAPEMAADMEPINSNNMTVIKVKLKSKDVSKTFYTKKLSLGKLN